MHFGQYIYWTILMAILQSKGDCALFQIHVYNFFTKNIFFYQNHPCFHNHASANNLTHQRTFSILWENAILYFANASVRIHDSVIKEKHFPRYWPFVRGIRRSLAISPHRGQISKALISLSAPERTVDQTIQTPITWDSSVLIMMSM